jgi:hypothetical protein
MNNTELAQQAVAAIQGPDAGAVLNFSAAMLLAAANPQAAEKVMSEFQRQRDEIAADREKLTADRTAFADYEAAARSELGAAEAAQKKERDSIDADWRILKASQERWKERLEKVEAKILELHQIESARSIEELPGGMTRMRELPPDLSSDPHFGAEIPQPVDDETRPAHWMDPMAAHDDKPYIPQPTSKEGRRRAVRGGLLPR